MGFAGSFAVIIAGGAALGMFTAHAVPTAMTMRDERPWLQVNPEDYPEIVGITYDAVAGPYYAPRAYSGIAPTIRDNIYDFATDGSEGEISDQYAGMEEVSEKLPQATDGIVNGISKDLAVQDAEFDYTEKIPDL